ncbi:maturation of Asn-linked oligosaccharides protein [Ceratobasidium sp. 414]|nr:maturation of Asn-linked oligosaccharides protein [Ceratobasidium sp. 414]
MCWGELGDALHLGCMKRFLRLREGIAGIPYEPPITETDRKRYVLASLMACSPKEERAAYTRAFFFIHGHVHKGLTVSPTNVDVPRFRARCTMCDMVLILGSSALPHQYYAHILSYRPKSCLGSAPDLRLEAFSSRSRTLFLSALALVANAANIQKANLTQPYGLCWRFVAPAHAIASDVFKAAYADYKKYAWGHDSLAPISKAPVDDRNGWGASIVDAMSTAKVMGLDDIYNEAVNFSLAIDFSNSKTSDNVSLFESTIRYLGGLISAYELGGKKDIGLIARAKELGDKLAYAWVGANDFPYNSNDFSSNHPVVEQSGIVLEWAKLSDYTGNETYRRLTEKSMNRVGINPAPLPGLPAQGIDPSTGLPVGDYITWGGGSDSYFEYLIKYGRLSNNANPAWTSRWLTAVDSSIRHLAQTAVNTNVSDLLYLGDYTGGRVRHIGSHLACFHGGNWIMGGRLTGNDTIFNYGLRLTEACWNTYQRTITGIGPEVFAYMGPDGNWTGSTPSSQDVAFYKQNGFYVYSGYAYYDLRPEVLESNFYAWRATGDIKYYNRAVAGLESIKKYCRPGVGVAGIGDVRSTNSGYIDHTESFFFAEVMKYIYLTFAEPSVIDLDKYVINTEAHPFEAPAALSSYQPSALASLGGALPSKTWSGVIPQISTVRGMGKKLSDVLKQALPK